MTSNVFLAIPNLWSLSTPILIMVAAGAVPLIFYLLTVQQTFAAIKPENRQMEPGLVWLTFIPLFGLIWQIIFVGRLADSLHKEFAERSIDVGEPRPGASVGLAYSILFLVSIIPVVGIFTAIAGLICWIIYWVKIAGYKRMLDGAEDPVS